MADFLTTAAAVLTGFVVHDLLTTVYFLVTERKRRAAIAARLDALHASIEERQAAESTEEAVPPGRYM